MRAGSEGSMVGTFVAASLLAAAAASGIVQESGTERPVVLRVTPQAAASPATIRVTAEVVPDEDNRELRLVVDATAFYSSSTVMLDGGEAPRTHSTVLKGLPAGTYEVRAVVVKSDGTLVTDTLDLRIWK
jgi:hypothetical protein